MRNLGYLLLLGVISGVGSAIAQVPPPHPHPVPIPIPHPHPHPVPVPVPHPHPHPVPLPLPNPVPTPLPGHGCNDPFYTNAQAYNELRAAENSNEHAAENFELVRQAEQLRIACLRESVQSFLVVQNAEGGANATGEAQTSFRLLMNLGVRSYSLRVVAEEYARLRQAENDGSHARSEFQLVGRAVALGHDLRVANASMMQVLAAEGGASQTDAAISAFSLILEFDWRWADMRRVTASYLRIRAAENSNAHAIENFRLIRQGVLKGYQIEELTSSFLSVLNSVGGANKTAEAQQVFRQIYRL